MFYKKNNCCMNCWHMMYLVFLNRYFFPNCCRDFLVLKVDLRHRTVFYPCSFLNINEKMSFIENIKNTAPTFDCNNG